MREKHEDFKRESERGKMCGHLPPIFMSEIDGCIDYNDLEKVGFESSSPYTHAEEGYRGIGLRETTILECFFTYENSLFWFLINVAHNVVKGKSKFADTFCTTNIKCPLMTRTVHKPQLLFYSHVIQNLGVSFVCTVPAGDTFCF